LEILIQKKKITTGELAKASSESSIQNASNKLRKLEALKLIERTTPSDRSGNVLSGRRIEVI
jgi:DNA-binding MarR family transcriptional regulator